MTSLLTIVVFKVLILKQTWLREIQNLANDDITPLEIKMSDKQLGSFIAKAQSDSDVQRQLIDCGSDNICVSELGKKYGHKFSPANVDRKSVV